MWFDKNHSNSSSSRHRILYLVVKITHPLQRICKPILSATERRAQTRSHMCIYPVHIIYVYIDGNIAFSSRVRACFVFEETSSEPHACYAPV